MGSDGRESISVPVPSLAGVLPSVTVDSGAKLLTEIQVVDEALAGDYFSTRDPNIAALCMCFGQKMYKYRVLLVKYGKREPQRVVEFQFAGHDKIFKVATNSLLDIRSSITVQNINVGEFLAHLRNIKTVILSLA
jgi:hypothetical protein